MVTRFQLLSAADYRQSHSNVFLVSSSRPAGLSRRSIAPAHWLPRVAPAEGLLAWLRRDENRWPYFCESYWADLAANPERWQPLINAAQQHGEVLLLHDIPMVEANPFLALAQFLDAQLATNDWLANAAMRVSPAHYTTETIHEHEL